MMSSLTFLSVFTDSPVFQNSGVTAGPTVVEGLDKLFDGDARFKNAETYAYLNKNLCLTKLKRAMT